MRLRFGKIVGATMKSYRVYDVMGHMLGIVEEYYPGKWHAYNDTHMRATRCRTRREAAMKLVG